ncbi:MAG: substrate-binding domain-containing protein [Actinobacteria bacterium]|nr:substrate-binding domain-containing protein [Actinomycetota bacterium]
MQMKHSRWPVWALVAGVLAAVAMLAAGCGGGSGSSSAESTTSSESSGSETSGSESSGTETVSNDPVVAEAAEKVEELSKPPTEITLKKPLPEAPPKGTMIWMNCDVPACTVIGTGVKEGVEAAGWKYETENYESADPATLTAALKRALAKNPTAVSLSGIPPSAGWSSVIPEYKAAGIPIVAISLGPTELEETLIANTAGPPDRQLAGENMAYWFIAESNGEGKALLQRLDGFPILKVWADAFEETVKEKCEKCQLETLDSTIADATEGTIPQSIVPALQSHPENEYLISADLEFLDSLPSLMQAAGLADKIKIAGATPTIVGQKAIKAGTWNAATPAHFTIAGWAAADAAFRDAMGLPVPAEDNGALPQQLLLTENEWTPEASFEQPTDYREQFEKLWQLK